MIGDFNSLPQLKEDIVAHEIFIALGTTKKQTPDKTKYFQIYYDYALLAAKFAKGNGAKISFYR
ncbi:MAG: hypothetical protein ABIN25_04020 [Ginsengibacter sp.]